MGRDRGGAVYRRLRGSFHRVCKGGMGDRPSVVYQNQIDLSRNKRDVWTVNTTPFKGAHFAVFPKKLIEPCILAGSPKNGVVLDCFSGAGTTGVVSAELGMKFIGIELNPEYVKLSEDRIAEVQASIDAANAQMSLFSEAIND